ncbi:MAG: sigma-54-dependent Fis family transcriptional regulator [Deltaproteobacteria bacterium]|nr:MAG: sigma-54-dependent Fis family transcriptional regulator [Deltaproteobacteria bacterium]RLB39816.1 MAG: sigma-54-dependent Fis family transcriptional regulator [Deltaproteobacteria bacterium]
MSEKAGKILLIDDDPQLRQSFAKILKEEGYALTAVYTGEMGLAEIRKNLPDVVILDLRLPGIDGFETYKAIREIDPKLPVIIMTAYGTTDTAIEATKLGAFDYVLKPFEIPQMLSLIRQAIDASRFMHSPVKMEKLDEEEIGSEVIIGKSQAMQEVFKAIGRVATRDATVLVRGESGTGKELVARAIYQYSARKDKPFLVINCVAIPETLLESELFGYEKGAFTGAYTRKVGKIEQANGGTVLLDEIGDMPLSIQAKILRLIQEKSIERLGGRSTIPVDVRIIAATNRNLEDALKKGHFREDLYYRLKVVTIWLPPLRERREDIPELAKYFLSRYSREMKIENPGLSETAIKVLLDYSWPGNVRELSNVIRRALIFSRGCPLMPEDIYQSMNPVEDNSMRNESKSDFTEVRKWVRESLRLSRDKNMLNYLLDEITKVAIIEALSITKGNRSRAAELLGTSRPTLQAKIEKYGIVLEPTIS